ncbi:ABC transporter permease [Arthrobacter sp. TES]|jgi:ABC-2 type transport system permease protein|uniref:Transport permease protein n=1 Tax=Paenarthrobacter ureafaciens TaxID=37931 RepID=A0AAX3EE83_PAEUR|nr:MULTISPECIES: ABC transporter permease [Paenarthrobacter]AMB41049.1 sugar ABC transporter permease [Arthrobacter sp. ATCC 21022]AOY70574.1 sugar ABC transporter permease [Arthrobacter sp. ZXY-2]ERI38292.1 sugar ABC transporter permease [Arthrobacter sp. AK-YN10]NKR10369.1 sugar ABC transporter permease [Arthrobacter sp. M5]NKR16919.1 sugar ABC transporter permease [Arthrobacter sp. M6]OEH62638.1 sugar ABC transporter permease [Arthrobacter sp. D4]OEH63210.1 sugar ABC transporter permease 
MADSTDTYAVPGVGAGLLDVFRRRYLLKLIVRKELRVRYRGSVLGLAWSYVKPLVQYVVLFLALGIVLRVGDQIPNYALYMFSGVIVVNFFTEAFSNATRSIVWNAPLVKKIYLPRELFPVASVWVAAVHFLPQLVVLLAAALLNGWRPDAVQLFGAALGFVIVAVTATGLGLLAGAINVFFRDAENIVDMLMMVVTWTSPVLYDWTMIRRLAPDWALTIYQLNPVTVAVELFHWAFWYPTVTKPVELPPHLLLTGFAGLGMAALFLIIGQLVFRRLEGHFAQEV